MEKKIQTQIKDEFIRIKDSHDSKSLSVDVFTNFTSDVVILDIIACIQKFVTDTCTIKIETNWLAFSGVRALAAWILKVKTQFRVIISVKDSLLRTANFRDVPVYEASIHGFTVTKETKGNTVMFEYYNLIPFSKL